MKKHYIAVGLLSIFGMGSAQHAMAAENRPGAMTLTAGAAYYHFSTKRQLNNAGMPTLALAYNVSEHWAFEGTVGNSFPDYHNGQNAHVVLYTADGIYRFLPYGYFQPYVLAGVGVMNLKHPINSDSQYQSNLNAGVGTQFFADDMIALRGEIKDLYTMAGGKNDWMVNFGVSFLFGNKPLETPVSAPMKN